MKKTLAGLLLSLLALHGQPSQAQTFQPKLEDLIRETQMHTNVENHLQLVWWVPTEFWIASMRQNKVTDSQIKELNEIFQDYVLIAAVDGNISGLGSISFISEEKIRESAKIFDTKGNAYSPIATDELKDDIKTMLNILKPIISNMAGKMGQNMQFLVYPAKTKDNKLIVSTTSTGQFRTQLGGKDFIFKLPLAALSPQSICKTDGEKFPSNYVYCPYHGTLLNHPKIEAKATGSN